MSQTNAEMSIQSSIERRGDPISPPGRTYARSRLLLGISGVGTWVIAASLALGLGVPAWLADQAGDSLISNMAAIAAVIVIVAAVQMPFDLFGGFLLPRRHGRLADPIAAVAVRWARGVAVYSLLMLAIATVMLLASRWLGAAGLIAVGIISSLVLLSGRTPLAKTVGGLRASSNGSDRARSVETLRSSDIGFTGGLEGVFRPGRVLVPSRWDEELEESSLRRAIQRRHDAAASGLWARGRWGALLFTWTGLAVAGFFAGQTESTVGAAVGLGFSGTAGMVLQFAAVYTLWSFAGLLVLPTLSRAASHALDAHERAAGEQPDALRASALELDRLQDDEPNRPGWIEAVFHPIPDAGSRGQPGVSTRFAAWDIARTSAFLGLSGLSPLGRAVHCNCGRPALWVYLPVD